MMPQTLLMEQGFVIYPPTKHHNIGVPNLGNGRRALTSL